MFWVRNHIGKSEQIDLFEDYSVTMNSPTKVTIKAKEKKLKGYMKVDSMNLYFDENGEVLKYSPDKLEDILLVTGLKYDKIYLYQPIVATDKKALSSLLKFMKAVGEYNFGVERLDISDNREVTIIMGDLQVQLGKESNLDRKLIALNDMYSDVIKHKGVLNMKHLSADGSYTMQEETTKAAKNKKKKTTQ
jgi:cell division protein FtsQ